MKKLISVFLTLCLLFALAGCSALSLDSADMMTPPRATGDTAEVEKLLGRSNNGNYIPVFPVSGENRSSIIFEDLDGDGVEEAVALYSAADDTVNILFASRSGTAFGVIGEYIITCDYIDRVIFADIDGDSEKEVVVGYASLSFPLKSAAVFNVNDSVSATEIHSLYDEAVVGDFDGDGAEDFLSLTLATAETPSEAILFSYDIEAGLTRKSSCEMDSEVTSFFSVVFGRISASVFGAVVDARTDSSVTSTQVIYYDLGEHTLLNPLFVYSGYQDTKRFGDVCSADVDRDEIMEIPICTELPLAGLSGSQVRKISWNSYDFSAMALVAKKTSVLCPDGKYMFTLSQPKSDSVTAAYDAETRVLSLYTLEYKGNALTAAARLLSIKCYDRTSFDSSKVIESELAQTNAEIYTYVLENPSNFLSFTDEEVLDSFELL